MENLTNLTKHNYYKGEVVSPENLNSSFEYPDRVRESLVSELLGYGIIQGFEIAQSNNLELKVSPGFAYNRKGERLILNEEQIVNVNGLLTASGTKRVVLGIKPDYIKINPVTDTEGGIVYTTWIPTVEVMVDTELSVAYFQLASITLNSQGITEITPTYNLFSLPLIEDICNPIGTVKTILRKTPPSAKWLLMDGKSYPKAQYPILAELLIDMDPSLNVNNKTFTVPNLADNARFLRMSNESLPLGTKQNCAVQNHVHDTHIGGHSHTYRITTYNERGAGPHWRASDHHADQQTSWTDLGTKRSGNPVQGGDTETRPYAYTVNYFIKAC